VLNDPDYVVDASADTSVSLGAFFEPILVIANITSDLTIRNRA
jgi:hypothetical protein